MGFDHVDLGNQQQVCELFGLGQGASEDVAVNGFAGPCSADVPQQWGGGALARRRQEDKLKKQQNKLPNHMETSSRWHAETATH